MVNVAPIVAPSGWLQLNVGGKELLTKLETLLCVKGSLLEEMAKKGHRDCVQDAAGVVHIDYDARLFEVILHFHRTGRLIRRGHSIEEILQEAKHWRLPRLEAFCNAVLAQKQRIIGALLPTADIGLDDMQPQMHDNGAPERQYANVTSADRQASVSSVSDKADDKAPQRIAKVSNDAADASESPQVTSTQLAADKSPEPVMRDTNSDKQRPKEEEVAVTEPGAHSRGQPKPAANEDPEKRVAKRSVFRYPTIVSKKLPDATVQSHVPDVKELPPENGDAKPLPIWDTTPEEWDGVWIATQQNAVALDQGADDAWNSDMKQEPAVTASVDRRLLPPGMRELLEVAASLSRGQSGSKLPATSEQSAEHPTNCQALVNGGNRFAVLNQLNALSNGASKTSSSSVKPTAGASHGVRATDAQHHRSSTSRGRYARGGGFGGTPRCMTVVPPAASAPWGRPHRPDAQSRRTQYGHSSTPGLRREEEW
ncbi:BTB/POZ domain-containing protein KCTD17 [Aphelenchoides avenae]|nr:BTB/POZ domain-containing protein KCTD17 [Aphelenchus avenae]